MYIAILLFAPVAFGLTYSTDLQEPRRLKGVQYCPYQIIRDQTGWSANQPPDEWLNVTFPLKSSMYQVTTEYLGNVYPEAYVTRFQVDFGFGNIMTSIMYWHKPWVLYLSWPLKSQCPNVTIQYGKIPSISLRK